MQRIASHRKVRPFLEKRPLSRTLHEAPIRFNVSGDHEVTLFPHAIADPFREGSAKARPVLFALVNGKLIQFYRSTGGSSKRPGVWLPTVGLFFGKGEKPPEAGKYGGHPNEFPPWVGEVSQRIGRAESKGEIQLHQEWDGITYWTIRNRVFKRVPEVKNLGY